MKINKKFLIDFETKIANYFNQAKIKSPVHLYYGNESKMINIFKKISKNDWVLCSWRSHYQALLKGVPPKTVLNEIFDGKSISLCFPKYKFYSSAIVGGTLPIALGIAASIKFKKKSSKVFCFIGDMTSETGIAYETIKYSISHKLPIHFIIEDNNLSVCTNTRNTWKIKNLSFFDKNKKFITYYKYQNKYPHAGAGIRVQF